MIRRPACAHPLVAFAMHVCSVLLAFALLFCTTCQPGWLALPTGAALLPPGRFVFARTDEQRCARRIAFLVVAVPSLLMVAWCWAGMFVWCGKIG